MKGIVIPLAVVAVIAAIRLWRTRHPAPMSAVFRWALRFPRHPERHLRGALDPAIGQRVLEIGPGIGVFTIPISAWLAPDGAVYALDVQRRMLAALVSRKRRHGVGTVHVHCGDARDLPWREGVFDAVCMISVLGEIPDRQRAIGEIARVLKPGGRLVVGETILDPDFVPGPTLRAELEAAGFTFGARRGTPIAYVAAFDLNVR